MRKFDALVLAGGMNNELLWQTSGVREEALIPIGDRAMVEYVVAALRGSRQIGRIALVGPVAPLLRIFEGERDLLFAPPGETAIESTANGLAVLQASKWLLVVTADIPLLTAEAVEDFLQRCLVREADFFYAIVSRGANEAKFPGIKRTYVHLREGTFTGGNVFLVRPELALDCLKRGVDIVRLRKKPVRLARLIGWNFIVKLLLKRLTLVEAEQCFSQLLGLKGLAIPSPYPGIGIDVDKISDLELVRQVLLKDPAE
jgi:GTP:adenosylcobinamide-phosphate guanylyltransferase